MDDGEHQYTIAYFVKLASSLQTTAGQDDLLIDLLLDSAFLFYYKEDRIKTRIRKKLIGEPAQAKFSKTKAHLICNIIYE